MAETRELNGHSVATAEANGTREKVQEHLNGTSPGAPRGAVGKRALGDILSDLRKPIPERLLETKTIQSQRITYVPWHRAQKILNHYTNGFVTYEVRDRAITEDRIMMTVRVTIHTQDGEFFMDGTGIEDMDVRGYGDSQSNAESMAFRRACARFGLGLDLYEG